MELPRFGVVHGQWDLRGKFEEYVGGVRVEGRSVLDVGTATGFLSFEAERIGASRVVSHDMSDVRQQTLLPFKDKDRKSTRLNSSHANISYAVFCLKKKKNKTMNRL